MFGTGLHIGYSISLHISRLLCEFQVDIQMSFIAVPCIINIIA